MLKKIAIGIPVGGVFVFLGTGLCLEKYTQTKFRQQEFYKQAMSKFRENRSVVKIFGEPIEALKIDLGDGTSNEVTPLTARLAVPVKGPQEKGTVYLWASRDATTHEWHVDRLELQLKKDITRRLLVYDHKKEQSVKSC